MEGNYATHVYLEGLFPHVLAIAEQYLAFQLRSMQEITPSIFNERQFDNTSHDLNGA